MIHVCKYLVRKIEKIKVWRILVDRLLNGVVLNGERKLVKLRYSNIYHNI